MNLLLVEDDAAFVETFREELRIRLPDINLIVAGARDEAFAALEQRDFDLVICDLSIPTVVGALDEDVEHGLAVRAHAGDLLPGTPMVVFSARGKVHHLKPFIRESTREDVFGDNRKCPMIDYYEKDELVEVVGLVESYGGRLKELEHVEVASGGIDLGLSPHERRVVQLLTRRGGGNIAHVKSVGGGLSGARALAIRSERAGGGGSGLVVAKIGHIADVQDERARYQSHAAGVLPHGSYTILADEVYAGAAMLGGISYTLLEGYDRSLFDVVRQDESVGADVIRRLGANLRIWSESVPVTARSVGDVRRLVVSDEEARSAWEQIDDLALQRVEEAAVYVRTCPQHGDLHCSNVLVKADSDPVVIDFGSCTQAIAAFDPVTLELCFLFHPDAEVEQAEWDLEAIATAWPNADAVAELTGRPEFARACRDWAYTVAGGDLEVLAAVYVFALKQFRYPNTDKRAAAALVRSACGQLIAST